MVTSSGLWEQIVPRLRGSPEPNSTHLERHGVAAVALVVEKLCSCVESHQPMKGPVLALGMLAGKVEERHDEAEMTGRLAVEDQLGMLRTRDPGGLHLDLLNESLVLGLVGLSGGPAGVCGRLGSVA